MKFGKRRWEGKLEAEPAGVAPTSAPAPVAESWTVRTEPDAGVAASSAEVEPVVDGEAVELPIAEVGAQAPEPLPAAARSPMPVPVAEEPVLVYTSGSEPAAVTPLAETGEAYASGHASGSAPSWPEPLLALAAERPEVAVGAAFAGGLLFAMILRRLGN